MADSLSVATPSLQHPIRRKYYITNRITMPWGVIPWHCGIYVKNDIEISLAIERARGANNQSQQEYHRVYNLQHPWLDEPDPGLQILNTKLGFPCLFNNVLVIDTTGFTRLCFQSFASVPFFIVCTIRARQTLTNFCCKTTTSIA